MAIISQPLADHALFAREFLRSPLRTASLVRSSPSLAARMLARLPGTYPVVVELGPGTGSFTGAIQQRLGRSGRHIAVELNSALADHLSARFHGVEVVHAPAGQLTRVLADRGLRSVDAVVSGLPWAAFAGPTGAKQIGIIAAALDPGGVYTQFTYSWTRWAPPARRQLDQLQSAFENVDIGRTVWRNLPPAFVYTCTRPRIRP